MKIFSLLLFVAISLTQPLLAQKKKLKQKKEKEVAKTMASIIPNLQLYIKVLASDSLEGRRTGTRGEQLAADYIKTNFQLLGIAPKGDAGGYFQQFDINEGKQYETGSSFFINDNSLVAGKDFFPLNTSANGQLDEIVSPVLKDQNTTWFLNLKEELTKNSANPHYDITPFLQERCKDMIAKGAKGIIVLNNSTLNDNLSFDKKATVATLAVPIVYLSKDAAKKYFKDDNTAAEVKIKIDIADKKRTGTNVVGYINNNAATTIIIGAHYDHLGFGEDKNSLYTGTKAIHNGADDNASGVAALLELARTIPLFNYKNNNYLFIAFSGEELGLYGSKYFTEHATVDLATVNYMVNMDMVGRLNDSIATATVGGFGTSPTWGEVIALEDKIAMLKIKTDSSGTGPSDHTSFYRKDIPVLFFFTGTHGDYHKPSDDYEKINFGGEEKIVKYILGVVNKTNDKPKLTFTKTRENSSMSSSTRFTVSLGIMPDYTFSGVGVRADGISEGKLAQKIGLKAGDILIKLGDSNITSVENYMKVLSQFKKGDTTKLITTRAGKEISYDITF
jgi:aminopeptidase YwaD